MRDPRVQVPPYCPWPMRGHPRDLIARFGRPVAARFRIRLTFGAPSRASADTEATSFRVTLFGPQAGPVPVDTPTPGARW